MTTLSSFKDKDNHKISDGFKIHLDQTSDCGISCPLLECLEKSPYTYNRRNGVTTVVPSFLNGSSSFLLVTRKITKAWTSLNFGKIPSQTTE